jgi:hypothetical protein
MTQVTPAKKSELATAAMNKAKRATPVTKCPRHSQSASPRKKTRLPRRKAPWRSPRPLL